MINLNNKILLIVAGLCSAIFASTEQATRKIIQSFATDGFWNPCGKKDTSDKYKVYDYKADPKKDKLATKIGLSFYDKWKYDKWKSVKPKITVKNDNKDIKVIELKGKDGTFYNAEIDISKPTTLSYEYIFTMFELTFSKNKTIYITHKEYTYPISGASSSNAIYPQSGPSNGSYRITDLCFLKNNNVAGSDISILSGHRNVLLLN